jgi:hypothetical protein
LSQGKLLGTWVDHGTLYVDLVDLIPDYDQALAAARFRDEKAIYHIRTGTTVDVTPPVSTPREEYALADVLVLIEDHAVFEITRNGAKYLVNGYKADEDEGGSPVYVVDITATGHDEPLEVYRGSNGWDASDIFERTRVFFGATYSDDKGNLVEGV